ncbi:heavy metal-associated isoprenylated plant protein 43-like [Populus alba x Populus x berolinensis]|uniref:Heavy metal-associated isoprenylated plant protein 43-like n=1 Tax=Populus alba x Populus x berolinensis TaxID=444605 RepID=A0AAD6W2W5_9ROSI|nr:heavy metal-associated isoprenylated plant protein 43-like [Populus alba x Populus x berolinensis]
MAQRTVLKVDISCEKCKKKLLKAVSTLEGVDKIEADQAKGTLTVTGNADPYEIIMRTRKTGKHADVVSIGPPPAPPKQDGQKKPEEKKPDEKKPEEKAQIHDPHTCYPHTCYQCRQIYLMPMPMSMAPYDEPNPSCSIM